MRYSTDVGRETTTISSMPSIDLKLMLTLEEAEDITRQKIAPRVLDWIPQGTRMLVLEDKKDEKVGSLWMTEEHQSYERPGSGFIIGVGDQCGITTSPGPAGSFHCNSPSDMLGRHVMFGKSLGKEFQLGVYTGDYESDILFLTPYDIWAIDSAENPHQRDEELSQAYELTKQGQEDKAAAQIQAMRAAQLAKA